LSTSLQSSLTARARQRELAHGAATPRGGLRSQLPRPALPCLPQPICSISLLLTQTCPDANGRCDPHAAFSFHRSTTHAPSPVGGTRRAPGSAHEDRGLCGSRTFLGLGLHLLVLHQRPLVLADGSAPTRLIIRHDAGAVPPPPRTPAPNGRTLAKAWQPGRSPPLLHTYIATVAVDYLDYGCTVLYCML
jgi:hypothetical protein